MVVVVVAVPDGGTCRGTLRTIPLEVSLLTAVVASYVGSRSVVVVVVVVVVVAPCGGVRSGVARAITLVVSLLVAGVACYVGSLHGVDWVL